MQRGGVLENGEENLRFRSETALVSHTLSASLRHGDSVLVKFYGLFCTWNQLCAIRIKL